MVVTLGKHKVRDRDNYVSKQLNPVFGRCSIWDNFKLLCHLVSYNRHVDIQMRRSEQGANHVTGAKYGKKAARLQIRVRFCGRVFPFTFASFRNFLI